MYTQINQTFSGNKLENMNKYDPYSTGLYYQVFKSSGNIAPQKHTLTKFVWNVRHLWFTVAKKKFKTSVWKLRLQINEVII